MRVVQVVAFGKAAEVVKLNEVPDISPNEVVVAVEASPIFRAVTAINPQE